MDSCCCLATTMQGLDDLSERVDGLAESVEGLAEPSDAGVQVAV